MTTIVYCHKTKTIAHESRRTNGSLIVSDFDDKIVHHGDDISFMSGSVTDFNEFNEQFKANKKYDSVLNVETICIHDGKVFLRSFDPDDMQFWEIELNSNRAIGSGSAFAFTALHLGKTAKESISAACELDVYSGGDVKVFDVKGQCYEDL
jgi:20S proteasome alpha/beta subunit